MTQDLVTPGAAKPPWDWKDDDCVRALIEALREEGSSDTIGARLLKRYEGSLTRSAITSGMNRPHVLKSIRRLAADADQLITRYRSRGNTIQSAARARKERAAALRKEPPPPSPRARAHPPKPSVAEAPPRRPMTEEEQANHDAITAYLRNIKQRR